MWKRRQVDAVPGDANSGEAMGLLQRWVQDESGSDLIEYALLAGTVGVMAAAALALMPGILSAVYQTWDSGTQKIWDPCDPGTASTCH